MACLYPWGISVFPYLDDWLLRSWSPQEVLLTTHRVLTLFQYLSLHINHRKFTLTSDRKIDFIRATLDFIGPVSAKAYLPKERFSTLSSLISMLQFSPQTTVKVCLQLVGHMPTSTFVTPLTRLHLIGLQMWLRTVYTPKRHNLSKHVTNSEGVALFYLVEGHTEVLHRKCIFSFHIIEVPQNRWFSVRMGHSHTGSKASSLHGNQHFISTFWS